MYIPWWRHQMETSSSFFTLWGKTTSRRWIPLTKAGDAERWCVLWSATEDTGWAMNQNTSDLRRYRADYDVTEMMCHSAWTSYCNLNHGFCVWDVFIFVERFCWQACSIKFWQYFTIIRIHNTKMGCMNRRWLSILYQSRISCSNNLFMTDQ